MRLAATALPNLALTATVFLLALDVLWYTQRSIDPLLLLFSHDVWGLRNESLEGKSSSLVRTSVKSLMLTPKLLNVGLPEILQTSSIDGP